MGEHTAPFIEKLPQKVFLERYARIISDRCSAGLGPAFRAELGVGTQCRPARMAACLHDFFKRIGGDHLGVFA
jgi:hypothetical protein